MATARPRTAGLGAVRRRSMRVYNEPFTPNVVETDENEALILRLELPDFDEQHVKVKVEEEARMVVVTGDRLVANNRLLILDKSYPIPQFCLIHQIHHKFQSGFLTITMPKRITPPPENPTPMTTEPERTTPEKESEKISPENSSPAVKKPEQTTPETGSKEISPENATPPAIKEPEQTTPEKETEKNSPENATPAKKESERTAPETGSGEISPANSIPPATKAEITEDSEEKDKGKSKGLKNQTSETAVDKAPTPAPAVAPPYAAGERESGEDKMTPDEKISSPDLNPTEKKEIENENPEKGKESKAEEMGRNEETAKIGAGASPPRMPLPVKASLTAAVLMAAAAAYLAFGYYGLSFAME